MANSSALGTSSISGANVGNAPSGSSQYRSSVRREGRRQSGFANKPGGPLSDRFLSGGASDLSNAQEDAIARLTGSGTRGRGRRNFLWLDFQKALREAETYMRYMTPDVS